MSLTPKSRGLSRHLVLSAALRLLLSTLPHFPVPPCATAPPLAGHKTAFVVRNTQPCRDAFRSQKGELYFFELFGPERNIDSVARGEMSGNPSVQPYNLILNVPNVPAKKYELSIPLPANELQVSC